MYRAELEFAEGPRRTVALKVFDARSGDEAQALRRFRDEARLLAGLRHRAIVGVHDLVELEAGWTIVLDWVPGADAAALIASGRAPLAAVAAIASEVADALDHAWRAPTGEDGQPLCLVHRDISARNIRVTPAGDVFLLDFGLARANAEREAETTQALGLTRAYAAPERVTGDAQSLPEGDIFSLGLVMLDLLRGMARPGHVAVSSASRRALLSALEGELAPLSAHGLELVGLIAAMTEPDPSARPSARVVAQRCAELAVVAEGQRLRHWAERAVASALQRTTDAGSDSWVGRTLSETVPAAVVTRPGPPIPWLPLAVCGLAGVAVAAWLRAAPTPTQTWEDEVPPNARGEVGMPEWSGPPVHLRSLDGQRHRVGRVPPGAYDVMPDDGGVAVCRIEVVEDQPVMLVWDADRRRCLAQ